MRKTQGEIARFERFTLVAVSLSFAFSFSVFGCGYSWQSMTNPWAKQGVSRIYVRTMVNNTLKPGVEVAFTSALIREFSRGQRIKLVVDEKDADAYVQATITEVKSETNSPQTVSQLTQDPSAQGILDMVVASDYVAAATINVAFVRMRDKRTLWTQTFRRSKVYPGGNRFGLQGDTSSLINSSQEALALGEIGQFLASDTYDTMLEAF